MPKELLFSVTKEDCVFVTKRGSGKGGQKRNKTESAVDCTHVASGAKGSSDDTRSQHKNKIIAFKRMTETKKFKKWLNLQIAKATGKELEAQQYADREMRTNILIECKNSSGLWEQWDEKTDTEWA